jgi:uncharacterized membrane protein YbhN (UPF0104 family)
VMSRHIGWRNAAYLAVVLTAIVLIVAWWEELVSVWRDHFATYLVLTALMTIGTIVQARNFGTFLPNGAGPSVTSLIRPWALGTVANYLGPFQPGLMIRFALLTRLGLSFSEVTVATLRQVFASAWYALAIASVSLLLIAPYDLLLPAFALLVAFLGVFVALPRVREIVRYLLSRLGRGNVPPHVEQIIAIPGLQSSIGIFAQYILGAAVFYTGYQMFGVEIGVGAALGLACMVYVSSLVAITPANFGVLELICTGFGSINGLSVEESLALAFIYRGAHISGALLLSIVPQAVTAEEP